MKNSKKIELLAPAGSYAVFQAVLNAGADAVYVGGCRFGARAYANNFSEPELLKAIDTAHLHGKKLYLTVNTLMKEQELEQELYPYLLPYYKQGLDAVIIQDIGTFAWIREAFPDLLIHASTQMTVTDVLGASWLKELGASRIVAARELSLAEIQNIHSQVPIEIEAFVHGALCYCYSGQCLLSSMLGERSGNRGRCAQPCRLPYEAYDKKKQKIRQSGNYLLSPKDLCTASSIPALCESGVFSFKIEGRMKQAEYAAGVVSIYRAYIDRYLSDAERYGRKEAGRRYHVKTSDLQKLYDFGNRSGFTDGYLHRKNGKEMITFTKPHHESDNELLHEEIRKKYLHTELKERIKGILKLKKEFSAKLEVECNETRVTVTGQKPEYAANQPLSRDRAAACIRKTGNTPFFFEELILDMDEDIFLPIGALNALRREALEKLEEKKTEKCRRNVVDDGFPAKIKKISDEKQEFAFHLALSVEQRSQLAAVLTYPSAENIYLDCSCYTRENFWQALQMDVQRIHENNKGAFLILPAVFRRHTARFYEENADRLRGMCLDGLVIKSYDEAGFVKNFLKNEIPVILDHNLYTYNNRAKDLLWKELGPLCDTAPLELNKKELAKRDNCKTELILYGYLPLMTSAQCIHANLSSCDKHPQIMYLKDRYEKYFPVKNYCAECYNTIYNTIPLKLFWAAKDFAKMDISRGRISFTVENEKEIRHILNEYQKAFLSGQKGEAVSFGDYTNGHYKRGVE